MSLLYRLSVENHNFLHDPSLKKSLDGIVLVPLFYWNIVDKNNL